MIRVALTAPILCLALAATAPAANASGTKLTQQEAEARLKAAGISWSSSGNCTDRQNKRCTSFEQINSGTIDGIVTLRNASTCPINITGGTEVGHATSPRSHYNGFKLDISHNPCIDGYIKREFTPIGNRPGTRFPQWRSSAGNVYCDETTLNHWDIVYL